MTAKTLSLSDALHCHRLLCEAQELGDQPERWQRHLATGLEQLIGGFGSALLLTQVNASGWAMREAALSNNSDESMHERFACCTIEGGHRFMPGVERLAALKGPAQQLHLRFSDSPGGLTGYHRSEFYERYVRCFGTGDTVAAYHVHPGGVISNLTILRGHRDRNFDDRASNALLFMNEALTPLLGRRLLTHLHNAPPKLSPRLRQTLDLLLAGESEKSIAAQLGVSPHTAHEYVVKVYRTHGVASRGELMARYLARRVLTA